MLYYNENPAPDAGFHFYQTKLSRPLSDNGEPHSALRTLTSKAASRPQPGKGKPRRDSAESCHSSCPGSYRYGSARAAASARFQNARFPEAAPRFRPLRNPGHAGTGYSTSTSHPSGASISPIWMPVSVSRSFLRTGPISSIPEGNAISLP